MSYVTTVIKALSTWLLNILIGIDQLVNAITLGYPDETISSRAWRRASEGSRWWTFMRSFIDSLAYLIFNRVHHCQQSFLAEKMRAQEPPELRGTDG